MAPRFPFTELCKTATLGFVISRVETSRPIDFRDILNAMETCIEDHMNMKFLYLFRKYLQPCLPQTVLYRMQNQAIHFNNDFVGRYIASFIY
jgi:hypothetical protein